MDTRTLILHSYTSLSVFSRYVQEGKHIVLPCIINFVIIDWAFFFVVFCCLFGLFIYFYFSLTVIVVVQGLSFKMFVAPLQSCQLDVMHVKLEQEPLNSKTINLVTI